MSGPQCARCCTSAIEIHKIEGKQEEWNYKEIREIPKVPPPVVAEVGASTQIPDSLSSALSTKPHSFLISMPFSLLFLQGEFL